MKANTTKIAVALTYPEDADAPFIAAKESGRLAERILDLAKENGVPVVQDDILANVLSVHKIGAYIPEETWYAVASIFAFIQNAEEENSAARKN